MDLEKVNKKGIVLETIINLLFIISVTTVTFLLLNIESVSQRIISIFCSFSLTCFVTFKFQIIRKIFQSFNKRYAILAIFFAIATSFTIIQIFYTYNIVIEPMRTFFLTTSCPNSLIMYALSLMSLFALYSFYYYFISRFLPTAILFIKSLEKTEKYYLICSTLIFALAIVIIYSITSIFYLPKINGEVQAFDVIYSSDTGAHGLLNDSIDITAIENDLRQPLFGVFALPFSIIAYCIGNLFSYFGNSQFILLAIIQIFLLNVISILLSRLLHLEKKEKLLFLVFYTVTYPFILFAFNLEQYIFGLFWLFCFIYSYFQNGTGNKFCFIATVGSLLTNGLFFPMLIAGKKIKQSILELFKTGLTFFYTIVVFGQLPIILNIFSTGVTHVSKYMIKDCSFFNVICQYSNFVKNCFIAPFQTVLEERLGHISFQLAPITSLSVVGTIIFILVIAGFILNRKNKFAKLCMCWVSFSIILLIFLGYGIRENGLILYSLYFSWAFISLLFLFFKKLFQKKPKLLPIFLILLIVGLLIVNLNGLLNLIQFGLQYYDHIM